MSAKFKSTAIAGLAGAGAYLAVQVLFRWSKLTHESSHELFENLGWMAFQAAIFAGTYLLLTHLLLRRFGYQANSSKSER